MRVYRPPLDARGGLLVIWSCMLLLAGCTIGKFDVDYPQVWAPPEPTVAQTCPDISGLYVNKGERRISQTGGDCYNECGSLISELSAGSDLQSFNFTIRHSSETADHVIEIRKTVDDILDVTEWRGNGDERKALSQFQLTRANEDFQCDTGELALKTRVHTMILLIGNAIGTESRVFSKAADGSLVMKRFTKVGGHVFIFPSAFGMGEWVRWLPAEATKPAEQ